jgi:hypothetical protein
MAVKQSRLSTVFAGLVLSAFTSAAMAQPEPAKSGLSETDRVAIFKAAGATLNKGKWLICTPPADSGEPPPAGAAIETVRDLNGDGRLEAVVTDSGTFCYGSAETGFQLLSQQADGRWRVMAHDNGIPEFLKTRGVGGWPDISVGGPGFCFPVQRWNGKSYALHHFEYEGKRCKPQR